MSDYGCVHNVGVNIINEYVSYEKCKKNKVRKIACTLPGRGYVARKATGVE